MGVAASGPEDPVSRLSPHILSLQAITHALEFLVAWDGAIRLLPIAPYKENWRCWDSPVSARLSI